MPKKITESNKYIFKENFIIGICVNTEEEFVIDLEDYSKISKYRWYSMPSGWGNYVVARIYGRKWTFMHRYLITPLKNNQTIDHINRNRMDNRKSNLRLCTIQENSQNSKIPKNNKSGIIGVYWETTTKKWRPVISINKKMTHLGSFDNKNDAIIIRLAAEKKYYGNFAPQKHLFEQYGI